MKLTKKDIDSALWDRLKTEINARIEALRERNDAHMPENHTAGIRGAIAELKDLLQIEVPDPVIEEQPPDPI